jgi:hypothetical protein
MYCQQNIGICVGAEYGVAQLNFHEPYRGDDRVNYSFSISPMMSLDIRLRKTNASIEPTIQYTYNNIPFFIGGPPLFPKKSGFSTIYIKNNHLNIGLNLKSRFIERKNIILTGLFGATVGIPDIKKSDSSYVYGTKEFGLFYELQYLVSRTNSRNSISFNSGVNFEVKLSKMLYLQSAFNFRLGLYQSVIYDYTGDIYISSQPDPLFDAFSISFSNSGFFFSTGIKYYLY